MSELVNYGMIVNQHGQFLQAYQMYPLLASYGFMSNGSHIRPEGFVASRIQGDGVNTFGSGLFRCSPAVKTTRHNSRHRLEVQCTCGKWIPFGRMGQHVKAHLRKAEAFIESLHLNPDELKVLAAPLTCHECTDFFKPYRHNPDGECACPKCQGYCECYKLLPDYDNAKDYPPLA